MQIYIDCDHRGIELCDYLYANLKNLGYPIQYINLDKANPYPIITANAIKYVKEDNRLILICGTGIGCSIVANRYYKIYAIPCYDVETAARFRRMNKGNVLCLGAEVTDKQVALSICKTFLSTDFDENAQNRITMIDNWAGGI